MCGGRDESDNSANNIPCMSSPISSKSNNSNEVKKIKNKNGDKEKVKKDKNKEKSKIQTTGFGTREVQEVTEKSRTTSQGC